jgi:hypothetical protein
MLSAIQYILVSEISALRICLRHWCWCSFAVYSGLFLRSCSQKCCILTVLQFPFPTLRTTFHKYCFLTWLQHKVLFPCNNTSSQKYFFLTGLTFKALLLDVCLPGWSLFLDPFYLSIYLSIYPTQSGNVLQYIEIWRQDISKLLATQ